jgi:hypothetical protein
MGSIDQHQANVGVLAYTVVAELAQTDNIRRTDPLTLH